MIIKSMCIKSAKNSVNSTALVDAAVIQALLCNLIGHLRALTFNPSQEIMNFSFGMQQHVANYLTCPLLEIYNGRHKIVPLDSMYFAFGQRIPMEQMSTRVKDPALTN